MAVVLNVEGISSGYGDSMVIRDLSFSLGASESLAILGKNGMGKSTLLKSIMGYLPKKQGSITLLGTDITSCSPHRIASLGMTYAAQEQALFTELSVYDNLSLGLEHKNLFPLRFKEILPLFPVFENRLHQRAGTLSGGEQKMLLVARSLMMHPEVMLLDEITEGLQPSVIARLADALVWERRRHGTAMLIIEQNIPFALKVSDRFMILKKGEFVDSGRSDESGAADKVFHHLIV